MRYTACVAVAAALILSGCLADDDPDLKAANRELMEDARAAIGEDAALYVISGIEPSTKIPGEATDGCGSIPADKNPGDGRASAWAYGYGSPSNDKSILYMTDAKGKVLCEEQEDFEFEDALPLTSWNVTSVQAAQTIAANVAGLNSRLDGAEVFMNLVQTPDGPIWGLMLMNFMAEDHGVWGVHAETREFLGNLTDIDIIDETPAVAAPENGRVTGSMAAGAAGVWVLWNSADITLQGGHETLELVVNTDDPLAENGQSYTVTVYLPDDTSQNYEATNGETITIDSPPQGEWSVLAYPVVAAAPMEYTVDYCAYTEDPCESSTVMETELDHRLTGWPFEVLLD